MRCRAALVAGLALLTLPATTPAADPTGVQFFEQKIRPVLVKECYSCHAADAKKIRGGLQLDSKQAMLKGGDSGSVLGAVKPHETLLLKALRGDEVNAMPPTGKLPDAVVADFERWLKMGAPDPRDGTIVTAKTGMSVEDGRKFWSFVPPRKPAVPAGVAWARTDLDRLVGAAQAQAGIAAPVAEADPLTLCRRVYIDLTGLPPTPEQIDAFTAAAKRDPQAALEKLVDELLASPAFGERWGRHWLDIARYADSNGRDENLTFHEAFRYRDYVIRAFNQDKPFDRFIREQVAGDLLGGATPAERDEHLTATGFLVVGPKVLADRDTEKRRMDVIDEQVETVGRAFLGMTLGCARCHDHKFDPVPTTDYYALAGIFSSTRTLDSFKLGNPIVSGWMLRPLGGAGGEEQFAAQKAHQKKLGDLAKEITKAKADLKVVEDKATMRVPAKLVGITMDDKQAKFVGEWKASQFSRPYVGEGYVHDDKTGKGEKSATFTPALPRAGEYEVQVSYTPATGRAKKVPVTVHGADGDKTVYVDQTKKPTIDGLFAAVGKFKFEAGDKGSVTIANKDTDGHVIVDAVRFVPSGPIDKELATAMGVPEEVQQQLATSQEKLKKLEDQEKALKAAAPPAPTLVMAVRDEAKVINERINIRGNPHQLGAEVPRGFLTVATLKEPPAVPAAQSGRKELGEWIGSRSNPLTARVYVNRVWYHLMGAGLVRTVDNFGVQGERPAMPEVLDHLAIQFMDDGWSTKKLVRAIVLSRVYRSSCANNASHAKIDPENKLFWRANRRRVEAEVLRDSILLASGKLDRTPGGCAVAGLGERAVDNESKGGVPTDANLKRAVYLPVIRNDLPPLFEVFDYPDPDVSTGKREVTIVATQALYLMNSPFANEQARHTAKRLLELSGDDGGRVRQLYRWTLCRPPTDKEAQAALAFVAAYKEKRAKSSAAKADPTHDAWAAVCLAMFGCTEFRFVE